MPEVSLQPNLESQPSQPQGQGGKGISWKTVTVTVLVVAVILAIVGGLYWFLVLNEEETTDVVEPVKVSTPSSTQATPSTEKVERKLMVYDSLFDHSTKKGDLHTISFKSPKNWILKQDDSKNKNDGHYYSITGINNFLIEMEELPGGTGGLCQGGVKTSDLPVITEKIVSNNQPLYIRAIGSKSKQQVEKAYLADAKEPCFLPDSTISSFDSLSLLKTKSEKVGINFTFRMSFQKTVTKEEFINSAEYKAAKELLQSLAVVN